MATSGSVNYTIDRDSLITQAYQGLGAVRAGGSASANQISFATTALQIMLKAMQADGLQLWAIKHATLIPTKGTQSYTLGPNGDHASLNMNKTEMRVAGVTSDTILEVDSTTGMTASDYIGVVLDDGTTHWTTISSVTDSDTVVISTGLASAAAVDNHIYWYTTKIDRPMHVLEVYRREYDSKIDVPITNLSRTDYYTLSDKDTGGEIVNYYYDPQMTDSKLYVWPTASADFAANSTLELIIRKPFDDMDSATDDFDFPQEWYETILYGLMVRLAPSIGYPIQDRKLLLAEFNQMKKNVMDWGMEDSPVFFTP